MSRCICRTSEHDDAMCFQLDYERGSGIGGASWGGARNVLGLWAFVCDEVEGGRPVVIFRPSSFLSVDFRFIFLTDPIARELS